MCDTDRYVPELDDPSFKELYEAEHVLDLEGRVDIHKFTDEERASGERASVMGVKYVSSGKGHFDVQKSNIQKCVRRCHMDGALHSFAQLWRMGGAFRTNGVNRVFQVMVSEDIGIAEPRLPRLCYRVMEKYAELQALEKDEEKDEKQFRKFQRKVEKLVIRTLMLIATCRKSRMVDTLFHYCKHQIDLGVDDEGNPRDGDKIGWDVALKEKALSVGADTLLDTLDAAIKDNDILSATCASILLMHAGNASKRTWKVPEMCEAYGKRKLATYRIFDIAASYIEGDRQSDVLWLANLYSLKGGEKVLTVIHAVAYAIFHRQDAIFDRKLSLPDEYYTMKEILKWDIYPEAVAYDKHTTIGKNMNRGVWWFYRYSAKIANAIPEYEEFEAFLYKQCAGSAPCSSKRKSNSSRKISGGRREIDTRVDDVINAEEDEKDE